MRPKSASQHSLGSTINNNKHRKHGTHHGGGSQDTQMQQMISRKTSVVTPCQKHSIRLQQQQQLQQDNIFETQTQRPHSRQTTDMQQEVDTSQQDFQGLISMDNGKFYIVSK